MLLDSNILIGYLNGDLRVRDALTKWRTGSYSLSISTFSITEVLSYPELSEEVVTKAKDMFMYFNVFYFDRAMAELAGELRRTYKINFPDAGIAATAIFHKLPLITRDKGFNKITELTVIEI